MAPPARSPWLPRLRLLGYVALGLALFASPALGQRPDETLRERARALFHEGLDFADRGDWERAVHRFRRALELRESGPIRFNLARSLSQMGRSVEALTELERLLRDSTADTEVREASTRLQAEIQLRLGRLTVEIRGEAEGAQVTVDGLPLPPERIGTPTRVDPGVRIARLLRGAEQLDVEEVEVPRGGDARVVLEVPPLALQASPGGRAGSDDAWVWAVVAGVALAAIAASVGIGLAVSDAGAGPSMGDFLPPLLELD